MTIIKPVLELGLLNVVVLITGLVVFVAIAVIDWRMPQEQASKERR